MAGDEIQRRGQALYDERIRAIVETPENNGIRIGYNAVYALGGTLRRTAPA